jgi:crotonobetainyl-CoA:carnitine CoA-transferase CaiB-like acyl-CoA transferase
LRPDFGTLAEAMSGYAYITGQPDGPPTLPAFGLADSVAGLTGAFAVLAALRHRESTGHGQFIDVSLLEPLVSILGPMFIEYDQLGTVPTRLGSRLPFSAPRNIYETNDGKAIAMSSSGQRAFERTMAAIGRADLIQDERFKTNRDRGLNVEALDAEIGTWCGQRTLQEALDVLIPAGAAAAPVYNVPDLFEDAHAKERGVFAEIEDEKLGRVRMQNIPVRMSRTPPSIKFTGRELGEHNVEVYSELLNLDASEVDRLKQVGVC